MSSIPVTSQPAQTDSSRGSPIIWGLRVALLMVVVDILVGSGGLQSSAGLLMQSYLTYFPAQGVLYHPGQQASGQIGEVLLLVCMVAIAFGLAYLLAQRPFMLRRQQATSGVAPVAAAVTAASVALVGWGLLVFVLGFATGYKIDTTFAYTGGILFILLLQSLAFLYAGFAAAYGDAAQARKSGAIAGLTCGIAVAVAWSAFDFATLDTGYATTVSIARVVVLPALGYFAGMQGASLWQNYGAGRPPRAKTTRPRTRGPFRFRIGSGVLWGLVGLLLVTVFLPAPYSPIDAVTGATTDQRFLQFGSQMLLDWVVVILAAVVLVGLVVGLRTGLPYLKPVRRLIGQGISYAVAIGGLGDRIRSRAMTRLALTLLLIVVFFWPYIDQFIAGAGSDARVSTLGDMGFYVILALGLNVVVGFAGLLDLGYVAFFAFGAYAWAMIGAPQVTNIINLFANLDHFPGVPSTFQQQGICIAGTCVPLAVLFWPALLIGALVAATFGILLGAPTLRLRGDYLAIVTLGFGEIVPIFFKNVEKLTIGTNGISGIPSPILPGLAFPWFSGTPFYYLMLGLIGVAVLCNLRLRDSRLGRAWVAIREDEIAAAASGINTVRTKLLAFATGAFFSGMAGVYHGAKLGIIAPDNFSFGDSITYIAMVVLGGVGSIPGVILGAVIIGALNLYILVQLNPFIASDPTSFIYALHGIDFSSLRNFVFGGLLIGMMLLRPQGLIPEARRAAEFKEAQEEPEAAPEVLGSLDAPPGSPVFTGAEVELRE